MKPQVPRSTMAMLPFTAAALVSGEQARIAVINNCVHQS